MEKKTITILINPLQDTVLKLRGIMNGSTKSKLYRSIIKQYILDNNLK